jgi:hypothetical protein
MASRVTLTVEGDAALNEAIKRFQDGEAGALENLTQRVHEIAQQRGVRFEAQTEEQRERAQIDEKVSSFKDLAITALVSAAISGLYNRAVGFMQGKDTILNRLTPPERIALEERLKQEAAEKMDLLMLFAD